jgi:hypothetical protein
MDKKETNADGFIRITKTTLLTTIPIPSSQIIFIQQNFVMKKPHKYFNF